MFEFLISHVYANTLEPIAGLDEPSEALGFIMTVANWIFAILITVAVIYVLLAAFKYLTSKGGEGVGDAHKMLLYAAVAIAVAVMARGVVSIASQIAGGNKVDFDNPAPRGGGSGSGGGGFRTGGGF